MNQEVVVLKKISAKEKAWLISKSKKKIRELSRHRKKKTKSRNNISYYFPQTSRRGFTISAPEELSIFYNRDDTLAFFGKALHAAKICKEGQEIFFDLSSVKKVSPEAVMYIIAIIKNVKSIKAHKIICRGNSPLDAQARQLFQDAGFYSYVYCQSIRNSIDSNRIQITNGNTANGPLAGKICDYVKEHCLKDVSTKRLYPLIMELMTNTRQHAYRRYLSDMEDNWYIFVENRPDCIYFVYLDTGAGIPYTIRKGFKERVKELFISEDAKFISSALTGGFLRTETGLEHRGKGLPEIYKISQDEIISNLTIISGKGLCIIDENGEILESNLNTSFVGTLFSWKYLKI